MRRLLRFLAGTAYAAAWALLLSAAGLLVLEESGVLSTALRASLAWRLGPLGEGLEVGAVRLRWFEPGVEVFDVRLSSDPARSRDGRPKELLHLARVHFSIDPNLEARPLRQLHLDGGRVRVSNDLIEGLNRFTTSWAGEGAGGDAPGPELEIPPFVVTDFAIELDLELPDAEGTFTVGTVDLLARPRPEGGYSLQGELRPSFSGAVTGRGTIRVVGTQAEDGTVDVRATADGLPLETADFEMPASLGPLPVAAFGGRLSLQATGHLSFAETFEARGELRAELFDARLQPREDDPWLEDLVVDLESEVAIRGVEDLWARDAWDTALRVTTNWGGEKDPSLATPVEVWGLFGRRVPAGAWARCLARAERLPLSPAALRAVGATDDMRDLWESWDAFSPTGRVDATIDTIVERELLEDGTFRYPLRAAAHVRHGGTSGLTFRGFPAWGPAALPGDRLGVPVPCTGVEGTSVFTFDQERARRWWLALVDLRARHPAGTASAWATISERDDTSGRLGPFLDLAFDVPAFELDETWQEALRASPLTRQIWADYNPARGRARTTWQFRDAPDSRGLSATGDVFLEDAELHWTPLPVPVTKARGHVKLRWAERSSRFKGPRERHQLWGYRPWGAAWEVTNREEPEVPGARVLVRGFARDDSLPAELDRPAPGDPPIDPMFWALEVGIDEMGLRGSDSDHLARFAEAFGELREELKAKGRMRLDYDSAVPRKGMPYVAHVEATPLVVEITPRLFPRRATDLSGRVLVRLAVDPVDPTLLTSDARAQLSGRWPRGVTLAGTATMDTAGEVRLRVLGAGPDPADPGLKGAFVEALSIDDAPGEARVDLSQSSLSGAVDFEARSRYMVDRREEEAENTFRVHLRGCTLENGNLRLDDLTGRLDQAARELTGARLEASLAGHPLVLRNVRILPFERALEEPGFERLLRAAPGVASGLATEAVVETRDLPLDLEHLASLMAPETLATLEEGRSWDAFVDLLGARLLITSPDDGEGVVALSGPLRAHDASIQSGLPIEVTSADVDLREMILERDGVRAWARIDGLQATLAGRELTDGSMILGLVDGRLTIDDLDSAFVGGRLRSLGGTGAGSRKAVGVDLTPPHRFDVALDLEDVQVDRLLRGVFQSSIADAGLLRATLQLSGTPDDVLDLRGRGRMRLTEGRLWSIPAMRELFTRLGFPNTAVFDQLDTRFEVREGVIDTHHVLVKSSLLKLFGSGTLGLDGRLRYDLDVRYGLLDRLGILNRLLYWLNRNLVRVSVRGDFARPDVRVRSSLLELFGGSPDEREQGLPLPEFAPLGPRF